MRAASLCLSLVVAFTAMATAAAGSTSLRIVSPSSVTLTGSSNVNKWRCVGRTLSGDFQLPAAQEEVRREAEKLERSGGKLAIDQEVSSRSRLELVIPIQQLDCRNPIMESDLRRTLKAKKFPNIEFAFDHLTDPLVYDCASNAYHARIAGTISLAGASRQLIVLLHGSRFEDRIRLRATIPTSMTAFGLQPPTALFGKIRANDALTVSFDLLLEMVRPSSTER